jgi:hypothetical protein
VRTDIRANVDRNTACWDKSSNQPGNWFLVEPVEEDAPLLKTLGRNVKGKIAIHLADSFDPPETPIGVVNEAEKAIRSSRMETTSDLC